MFSFLSTCSFGNYVSLWTIKHCSCSFNWILRLLKSLTSNCCRDSHHLLLDSLFILLVDIFCNWLHSFLDLWLETTKVYTLCRHLVKGLCLLLLLHCVFCWRALSKNLFKWQREIVFCLCFWICFWFRFCAHLGFGFGSKESLEGRRGFGFHLGLTLGGYGIDRWDILVSGHSQKCESDRTDYVPILHFSFIIICDGRCNVLYFIKN